MKKSLFFTAVLLYFIAVMLPATAEIDSFVKNEIVSGLTRAGSPFLKNEHLVFTAAKNARFVGIAFGFENYKRIHSFERSVLRNEDGKEIDSVLFYILSLPKNAQSIEYRLIIDGLWTFDPLNTSRFYDPSVNTLISTVDIQRTTPPATEGFESGLIRFVCEAPENMIVRVAGNFNNWDSYMYTLSEIRPGYYQLDLPLPPGTYYYSFYRGTASFTDVTNPQRAYTQDGRVASVITVQ